MMSSAPLFFATRRRRRVGRVHACAQDRLLRRALRLLPVCAMRLRTSRTCCSLCGKRVADRLDWQPNSALANYYQYRHSRMGMHADAVDRLDPDTAVAVVSLGAPRLIMFERHDGSDSWARTLRPGILGRAPALARRAVASRHSGSRRRRPSGQRFVPSRPGRGGSRDGLTSIRGRPGRSGSGPPWR